MAAFPGYCSSQPKDEGVSGEDKEGGIGLSSDSLPGRLKLFPPAPDADSRVDDADMS
jgi:hypothetical protein